MRRSRVAVVLILATAGLALFAGSATGQAVTKRYRGNHVFDRIKVDTLELLNIDAGASGSAGTVEIFPTTASKGKISISATANTNNDTTTITNAAQGGAYTYTIPDAGEAASFVMTEGAQTINDVKTFGSIPVFPSGGITLNTTTITATEVAYLDGLTLGTLAASKVLTLDAGEDATWPATGILTYGGTGITASGAELNYNDITTAGTAQASKALVADSSVGVTGVGLFSAGNYRKANGTTITVADPNTSRATLRAAGFFCVDTTANAVDIDLSDDADFEAADLGTEWIFAVCVGGTNALTVTNGASGVVIKPQAATTGTSAEDVGDYIKCFPYALEGAICTTFAAD